MALQQNFTSTSAAYSDHVSSLVLQEGSGRGSGGSSPTSPAGRAREGREGPREPREGPREPREGAAGAADWVRRERLGKKGEFRYF